MNPLVANTIHDIKNTMQVLVSALNQAQHENPSQDLSQALDATVRVGAQLVELLAIYRADQANLRLAIADHDLIDFCNDVCGELLLPKGQAERVKVDVSQAAMLGAWAFDAYQVKMTLQDALRNALRHSDGVVSLTVAPEPGGGIRFTVRDQGPGFPADILEGEQGTMQGSGSGLGLTFARLIAMHHNTPDGRSGRVELRNDDGALFSLVLP